MLQAVRYARTMAILHQVETELVLVSAGEGARQGSMRSANGKIDPASARIEVRVAAEALRHAANLAGTEHDDENPSAEDWDNGRERPPGAPPRPTGMDGDGGDADSLVDDPVPDRLAGDAAASGAALGDFADEIHSVFPCGTVVFEFVKFTDDDESERGRSAGKGSERKRGDGRERPPGAPLRQSRMDGGPGGIDGEEDPDDLDERTEVFLFDSDGICRPFEILLKDGADVDADSLSISFDRWGRGKIEGRDDDD